MTARRDWVPICTFCAREHRWNCWKGKLVLLGDSNIPVTTHTTPVVVHDIALQLRLQLFVAALGCCHSSILGYLKWIKKDKSVFVSKRKQASKNKE